MWTAGEIAVCVQDPYAGMPAMFAAIMPTPPEVGKQYRVLSVSVCRGCGHESLVVRQGDKEWHSELFRKVQKSSDDFKEQIKKMKPVSPKVRELEDA